jgi:hypothetical protein
MPGVFPIYAFATHPRSGIQPEAMRSFWSVSYAFSLVAALCCVGLFVVALVKGVGVESVVILAAGAFWVLMAYDDRRR